MKEQIEKLLAEKKLAKRRLNKDYESEIYTSRWIEEAYSEEYDKLETEIELLQLILKD